MSVFKKFARKLTAVIAVVATCMSFLAVPVLAAPSSTEHTKEATVVSSTVPEKDGVIKRSTKLMAYGQAYIHQDGEVKVHLSSSIWGGYLELTPSGGKGNIVRVKVIFPSGSVSYLTDALSNGGSTGKEFFLVLPKGDYTFLVDGVDDFYALACIYND